MRLMQCHNVKRLQVQRTTVTIKSEEKEEKTKARYASERHYGSFCRSL